MRKAPIHLRQILLAPLILGCLALFLRGEVSTAMAQYSEDEAAVYDVFEKVIDDRYEGEFEELSGYLHPNSLELFREYLQVVFERLSEKAGAAATLEAVGLGNSPANLPISDREFFVAVMTEAYQRNPEVLGSEDLLPLKILGTVFSEDGLAYVLFQYNSSISSKKSRKSFITPSSLTFAKDENRWTVYGSFLHKSIEHVWTEALLPPAEKEKE